MWLFPIPYPVFFGSQDLQETCADTAGRISRLRPDFAFFFQSCAPLKTAVAGFETGYWFFHVLFIPAWDEDFMWRSRDGLKHVEARRWLKADLHQHTTCASWSRFPGASIPGRSADIWRCQPLERSAMKSSGVVAITILSKDDADNTVLVLVLLFPRFTIKYEATQYIFLRTDWRKSSDIYQTSFAPCMLTILRSKSGMNGHSKRRLGVSLNCEKSDTKLCLYISVGSKESRWAPPKSNGLKPVLIDFIYLMVYFVRKNCRFIHPHCHSWVITCR